MIASRSCCRFVSCASMLRIPHSTTSQRCSIGLSSGYCGGHLSKVNSLSCSRIQSDLSFVTWCIILLEVAISRWVHYSHKGMDMVSNSAQVGCGVKQCSIGTKGPKMCQKKSPTPLNHHHQPEPLRQGRMDPGFHVLYTKF